MKLHKLIILPLSLCILLMVSCFSISLKNYNPLDKEENILPGREQLEVKYSRRIGEDWTTEVILGPENEYVNVGFSYRPNNKDNSYYANLIFNDLNDAIKKRTLKQIFNDDTQMVNVWSDVYSFKLENIPISFQSVYINRPDQYTIDLLSQKKAWHLSIQMFYKAKLPTINCHKKKCLNTIVFKENLHAFPNLPF